MASLGDFDASAVIYGKFTTYRPSTGATFLLGGTPALSVYKDNSVTQSTTGVTLTADFDSVTGLNHFAIDTSADGAFYAAGSFFDVVITTGTVDSVSVTGSVVGSFTLRKTSALKPTTAARTLDVSAGGEAGVDWANVGSPTTTLALTGTTVGTATTVTQERGKYALGAVWIGPAANTNTVSYTDGIITNPVSTIAVAKTIADALGLRRFYTVRTGATQLGAAMTGYDFDGANWALGTTGGSRDVGTSYFRHANLTSAGSSFAGTTGTIHWDACEFEVANSVGISHMTGCTFADTLTLLETGNYDFIDCASVVAGTAAPVFAVPAGTVNISFRRWSGGIKLTGLTAGTTVSIDMVSGGTVTLEGTAATVVVRGMATGVTNSMSPSAGSVTTTAVCNQTTLATPTNITAGTITTVSGNVNGSVGSVTGAVGSVTGLTASDVGAIKTKTDFLPSATAGDAGGVFIAGTNAATTVTTALTTTFTGNLTGSVGSVTGAVGSVTGNVGGNVAGSVGSVTGAVGSVTGAVGSVTGAVGSVTGNVGGNVAGSVGSVTAITASGGIVSADIKKVNNVVVNGDGAGTPWGP